MIWESHYWKRELLRVATKLNKRLLQKKWPASSMASLEKEIMIGFYIIRKLIEAHKLSNIIFENSHAIRAFPRKPSHMTFMNSHHLDRHYDFSKAKNINKKLPFICNKIIHSYIFIPSFNENGFIEAVLVTSDTERKNYIFELPIRQIASLFNEVGKNYPHSSKMTYCEKIKDYKIINE